MQLKTIESIQNGIVTVSLEHYDRRECREILLERNSYVLEVRRSRGDDYGGSQHSEEEQTTYEEIIPERILVKDGHFCGVLICVEYDCFNGGQLSICDDAIILLDKTIAVNTPRARSGFSFSNDNHDRWDYDDYYLVERPQEDC